MACPAIVPVDLVNGDLVVVEWENGGTNGPYYLVFGADGVAEFVIEGVTIGDAYHAKHVWRLPDFLQAHRRPEAAAERVQRARAGSLANPLHRPYLIELARQLEEWLSAVRSALARVPVEGA